MPREGKPDGREEIRTTVRVVGRQPSKNNVVTKHFAELSPPDYAMRFLLRLSLGPTTIVEMVKPIHVYNCASTPKETAIPFFKRVAFLSSRQEGDMVRRPYTAPGSAFVPVQIHVQKSNLNHLKFCVS